MRRRDLIERLVLRIAMLPLQGNISFDDAIATVESAFGMKRTALVKKHTNLLAVLAAQNITATCDDNGDWELSYYTSDLPTSSTFPLQDEINHQYFNDPAQHELLSDNPLIAEFMGVDTGVMLNGEPLATYREAPSAMNSATRSKNATLRELLRVTNELADSVHRCEVCNKYKHQASAVRDLANEVGMVIETQRTIAGVIYRIGAGMGELTVRSDGLCDNCDVAKLRRALGLATLPPPAKA